MSIRIAILGTRGIPNHYGGFERLAEQLSRRLVEKGNEVYVYNSHNHFYKHPKWLNVHIIHCYDPEYMLGTCGQFIYDFNCIMDARRREFDLILILGYTSSSVWHKILPADSVIIYNMDGLEWKRAKYSKLTRKFLNYAERLAVQNSHYLVTDSPAMQLYFKEKYDLATDCITYGGEILTNENEEMLKEYGVCKKEFFLLVARMEPENNIENILEGFCKSKTTKKFLVVGNTTNKFGKYLVKIFSYDKRIHFLGAIYDTNILHCLRIFCHLYFHGHSTGGTNPSLLEAMASKALIVAHDNIFNRLVLQDDAFYFRSWYEVNCIIEQCDIEAFRAKMIANNFKKIQQSYDWQEISLQYERLMLKCLNAKINERNLLHKRYSSQ